MDQSDAVQDSSPLPHVPEVLLFQRLISEQKCSDIGDRMGTARTVRNHALKRLCELGVSTEEITTPPAMRDNTGPVNIGRRIVLRDNVQIPIEDLLDLNKLYKMLSSSAAKQIALQEELVEKEDWNIESNLTLIHAGIKAAYSE